MNNPLVNKTLGNAAMLAVGAVGEALLQFVFIVVAGRELGPEEFGFYGYLLAIFTFVQVVVHFGLPVVVVREMTSAGTEAADPGGGAGMPLDYPKERRDSVVFAAMTRIRGSLAIIFFALAIVASLIDTDAASRHWAVWLMFVMLLFLPFDLSAIFDSRKMSRWDVPGKIIGRIVSVGLLILIWQIQGSLTLTEVAACSTLNVLVNIVIGWQVAKKLGILKEIRPQKTAVDRVADLGRAWASAVSNETTRLIRLATPIMWATLMTTVYLFSQTILVKWLSTDLETGYYALASRLVFPMALVKGILYRLILPLLAEVSNDKTAFTSRVEKVIGALCLFFMPAVALAIPACELFLVPIFGPDYAGSVIPSQIGLSHLFFTGMGSIFGTALFAMGYQKTYTWSLTIGCVVCLGLGAILIPIYGATGAAWATVAAESSAVLVALPPFLKHCRPKAGRKVVRIGLSSLAGLAVYYALVRGFDISPTLGYAAAIVSVAAGMWASGEISPNRVQIVVGMIRRKAG